MKMIEFQKELENIINKHGIDNYMNVCDFILSQAICDFIETVDWVGKQTKKLGY